MNSIQESTDCPLQPQLLNVMWCRPPTPTVWQGYREELERAGVLVPVDRASEFAWIDVQWRQPRPHVKNTRQHYDFPRFDRLVSSLGSRLVGQGLLQSTHLVAPFSPATEVKVISNRWLALLLVAKSSDHLWSVRCTTNAEKLRHFTPSDIAEAAVGLCWHRAIYLRRDRLEPLLRETYQWEKDHESEIKGI